MSKKYNIYSVYGVHGRGEKKKITVNINIAAFCARIDIVKFCE